MIIIIYQKCYFFKLFQAYLYINSFIILYYPFLKIQLIKIRFFYDMMNILIIITAPI